MISRGFEPAKGKGYGIGTHRVRWRGVVAGVLLTAGINAFDPISRYLIHSSSFTHSQMPFALLMGLLALGYLYNPFAQPC